MGRTSADQTRDWRFATTLNSDPELAGNRHPESWEEVVHRDLGAPGYRHLVQPLQGLPPREARLRKVQEAADTRDLYLCLLPPARRLREQGSKTAVVVQASAWVLVPEPVVAVVEVFEVQEGVL